MRKLILALVLSVNLGGCALFQGFHAVSDIQVSEQAVYVAANAFNVVQITATNYLRLKKCDGSTFVCRSPTATAMIIPAIRSGRAARDELETFTRQNPGRLGSAGTYNALVAATNSIKAIFVQYGVNQ